MRETKYRYYYQHDDTGIIVVKDLTIEEIESCKISENSIELGVRYGNYFSRVQSTGLLDKNSVEIYEGDIVKWGHLKGWSEEYKHRYARVVVVKY